MHYSLEVARPNLDDLHSPPPYRGYVESFASGLLTGWCIYAENARDSLDLEVVLNSITVARTSTGTYRKDISDLLGYDCYPQFSFDLRKANPDDLRSAYNASSQEAVSINVRVNGVEIAVSDEVRVSRDHLWHYASESDARDGGHGGTAGGTDPRTHNQSKVRGYIDAFHSGSVSGWCLDLETPGEPVEVLLYIDDIQVGHVQTNTLRPDVSRDTGLAGRCGFTFESIHYASEISVALERRLAAIVDSGQVPEALFTVRSVKCGTSLPTANGIAPTIDDLNSILSELEKRRAITRKNMTVQVRDTLLETPILPNSVAERDVSLLAFYLPQFHPFAENNDWWGEGFSEWTNVVGARPRFDGHQQPKIPADLGFYDLRVADTQKKQVEIATRYGITGFCYHYYWFSGQTLMTLPIDRHIEEDLEIDFCLCWANENWSRRWDGSESEVLLSQQHTVGDDFAFIESVLKYFRHPKYVKIGGAPLLIVYRLDLLADASAAISHWKRRARESGFPDIHVCMAETFGLKDPYRFGANSSCQFPPHGFLAREITHSTSGVISGFSGKIFDYASLVSEELKRAEPTHVQFRCVMPGWDNTARRSLTGHVYKGATPELFEAWLSSAVAWTRSNLRPEFRFVFINAWNEWAEGAYLEPDQAHGFAFLRSVRNALSQPSRVLAELDASEGGGEGCHVRAANLIRNLLNTNRQLTNLLSEYARAGGPPSPFVSVTVEELGRLVSEHTFLQLDSINGWPQHLEAGTILKEAHLSLSGWFNVNGHSMGLGVPSYLLLKSDSTADAYIASIIDRTQRFDVTAALGLASQNAFHGFNFRGDLRRVRPGTYYIGAVLASDKEIGTFYTMKTPKVVNVG